MKISIITPSFNQADFLDEAIRSVLNQDYPDLEYIVVDGASTDGSVGIIKEHAERLTSWLSEIDAGQADAINKGFARATGEIVAWLNSDDVYLPETLARVAKLFEENPDAGMIYGDVLSIDGEGNPINVQRFAQYTLEDLMAFKIISQPGVFMRREVLEDAVLRSDDFAQAHFSASRQRAETLTTRVLDPNYHFLLDHHLWLRMAQLAPMVYTPQILAKARYHAAAKNIAHAERFGREAFQILEWMKSQPMLIKTLEKNERKILAGAYHLDAFYLVEAGKMRSGLAAYSRAFFKHPPTAMKSWKRILYALFSLLGLGRIRKLYIKTRQKQLRRNA